MEFTPVELVQHARTHSPFYRDLYARLPHAGWQWHEVPIVDQTRFWTAQNVHDNRVVCNKQSDGIVFKSGGTTGAPKFSAFTLEEWNTFTRWFGWGLKNGGLRDGSRVANIFFAGDLYASFLFIMKSLENSEVKVTHFPLAGAAEFSAIADCIEEFQIDVLAGLPTSIVGFERWVVENKAQSRVSSLRTLLFGGESMYSQQRQKMCSTFPNIVVQSIGYASVDAGLLGYVTPDCDEDEHFPFEQATLFEIIDEDSGEVIETRHRPGRVVVTNLTRKLMPIIRYPAGDMAEWTCIEPGHKRFRLLGRSEEGARIGPVTLYYDDVRRVLESLTNAPTSFQIVVEHRELRDGLTIVLQTENAQVPEGFDEVELWRRLYKMRPMLEEFVADQRVHKPLLLWSRELKKNPRTGKLRRILDFRKGV